MSYIPKYLSESSSIKHVTVGLQLEGVATKRDSEDIIHADNNHVTAETGINNLKTEVDGIDLTKYFKKSDYDTKVGNLELKLPDVSGKLNTSDFNSKVSELESKIRLAESKPDITTLATKSSVTAVGNKIPDVKRFVEETDYAAEITSIKND